MLKLTRWCIAHRGRVFVAWLAVAILTTAVAGAAGRNYATNFTLPGTQSQRVLDLLKKEFPAQSGDTDTIVFHTQKGTIDDPQVKAAMTKLLDQVSNDPHVVSVRSPYGADGAVQVSRDRRTAFATVNYDKPSNQVPNDAGKPVLDQIGAVNVPGLQVAAGGQVMENAEGFSVGPATLIGAIAALIILLFTFGSLVAAGMPLITAGFGLITGVALIGLATHVTSIPNVSTDLALMIGLGVGDRLRAVHRHALPRELSGESGTWSSPSSRPWTPPGGRSCSPALRSRSRCSGCSPPASASCTGSRSRPCSPC